MAPACQIVAGIASGKVIADRAYDGDSPHDVILEEGGEPDIPPRRHRKHQHGYDKRAYRQRWVSKAYNLARTLRRATRSSVNPVSNCV